MLYRGLRGRRGRRGGRGAPPVVGLVWLVLMAGILLWGTAGRADGPAALPAALGQQLPAVRQTAAGERLRGLVTAVGERASALVSPRREADCLAPPEDALLSPVLVSMPLRNPVAGRLTSPYGYRTHPTSGVLDFHTGVDIAAPEGTPVSAALPGVVEEVGESPIYGRFVTLRHGNLSTRYCHCAQTLARVGQRVREGEYIAAVGQTGVATGPHLHLEVRVENKLADPLWVLPEGEARYWTSP